MQGITLYFLSTEIRKRFARAGGDLSKFDLTGLPFIGINDPYVEEDAGVRFEIHRLIPKPGVVFPRALRYVELVKLDGTYLSHLHYKPSGKFYMLEGDGAVCLDGRYFRYSPGRSYDVPRRMPHCFTTGKTTWFISFQDYPIKDFKTDKVDLHKDGIEDAWKPAWAKPIVARNRLHGRFPRKLPKPPIRRPISPERVRQPVRAGTHYHRSGKQMPMALPG